MSASLVKKSLDLFKDDLDDGSKKKKKKGSSSQAIGTNRQGVRKKLSKLKKREQIERSTKLRTKQLKTAVDDVNKRKSRDQTEANLDMILQFSTIGSLNAGTSQKILKQSKSRLARDQSPTKEEENSYQSILFSDRQFDKKKKDETFWEDDD